MSQGVSAPSLGQLFIGKLKRSSSSYVAAAGGRSAGAPGEEDVIGVVSVAPGLVLWEGLGALAEGRLEVVVGQGWYRVADACLSAVAVVHVKVQQRHPLNACHTRAPRWQLSSARS